MKVPLFIASIAVCIFAGVLSGCTTVEVRQTMDVGVHQQSLQSTSSLASPTSEAVSNNQQQSSEVVSNNQQQSSEVETSITLRSESRQSTSTSEPKVKDGEYMHFSK